MPGLTFPSSKIFVPPSSGDLVNVACPVNWAHPLNNGRVGWWKVVANPGWRGGNTLRDLVRGGHTPHDGTLSGTTKPTWGGSRGLTGSSGSLLFDGSTSNVSIAPVPTTIPCTYLVSIFRSATGGNYQNIGTYGAVSGFYVQSTGALAYYPVNGASTSTGNILVGKWYRVGCIIYNTAINGIGTIINGNIVTRGGQAATNGPSLTQIGADATSGGDAFIGFLDNATLYNRPLSAQEVALDYALSRQGYPGVLNYLGIPRYSTQATIALDAISNRSYPVPTSSLAWTHTWNGSNRFLAIDIQLLTVTDTVVAVTYGGATCTFVGAQNMSVGRVEQWRICQNDSGAPTAGSNVISVTLSGSVVAAGEAVSYTGVNQSSPTEAWNGSCGTNGGSAINASVNVTPIADNTWTHAALATNEV